MHTHLHLMALAQKYNQIVTLDHELNEMWNKLMMSHKTNEYEESGKRKRHSTKEIE